MTSVPFGLLCSFGSFDSQQCCFFKTCCLPCAAICSAGRHGVSMNVRVRPSPEGVQTQSAAIVKQVGPTEVGATTKT